MKKKIILLVFYLFFLNGAVFTQPVAWRDDMKYSNNDNPWTTNHGDGDVETSISKHDKFLRFHVNAEDDRHNAWWAVMQRGFVISDKIPNPSPDMKLWMEAEVRSSHPMRRINMRLFSPKYPTDPHANLMEFDLADTSVWYKIRFSPKELKYQKGDPLMCHFALMDWGQRQYHLDVRNVSVFFAKKDQALESANALPYHPEPKPPEFYTHSLIVTENGMIDLDYPAANLSGWGSNGLPLLSVSHGLTTLLRWDFSSIEKDKNVNGWGLLRLKVHSSQQIPEPQDEFCRVRIVEIIGGREDWYAANLTYEYLANQKTTWEIFNEQMVIDMFVPKANNNYLDIPIPPNVLKRIITGRTKGLAIIALGSIQVSFYAKLPGDETNTAKLYFNFER